MDDVGDGLGDDEVGVGVEEGGVLGYWIEEGDVVGFLGFVGWGVEDGGDVWGGWGDYFFWLWVLLFIFGCWWWWWWWGFGGCYFVVLWLGVMFENYR